LLKSIQGLLHSATTNVKLNPACRIISVSRKPASQQKQALTELPRQQPATAAATTANQPTKQRKPQEKKPPSCEVADKHVRCCYINGVKAMQKKN
jgi:hypothetical protein